MASCGSLRVFYFRFTIAKPSWTTWDRHFFPRVVFPAKKHKPAINQLKLSLLPQTVARSLIWSKRIVLFNFCYIKDDNRKQIFTM
jgi:hypothetical protein